MTNRPPSLTLPPSIPYLATNTQNHNPSLSTSVLQHHLPKRVKLNSLNCLTPKPPYSFRKQIDFQETQVIFLDSSHAPPKKKINQKRFDKENDIWGALKKERA
jgi:hypothetical protein